MKKRFKATLYTTIAIPLWICGTHYLEWLWHVWEGEGVETCGDSYDWLVAGTTAGEQKAAACK